MKCALSFNAVKLLVGGVLVHGAFGARVITMNPGVKMIRGEQHFFAVADVQLGKIQQINEFSRHKWPLFRYAAS